MGPPTIASDSNRGDSLRPGVCVCVVCVCAVCVCVCVWCVCVCVCVVCVCVVCVCVCGVCVCVCGVCVCVVCVCVCVCVCVALPCFLKEHGLRTHRPATRDTSGPMGSRDPCNRPGGSQSMALFLRLSPYASPLAPANPAFVLSHV